VKKGVQQGKEPEWAMGGRGGSSRGALCTGYPLVSRNANREVCGQTLLLLWEC